MNKNYDVIALGEMLIDFTLNGKSGQGNNLFEANPGGAPCNVLAILRKLGKKTAFIGKVGNDQFGRLLKETIEEAGSILPACLWMRRFIRPLHLYIPFRMGTGNSHFTEIRERI